MTVTSSQTNITYPGNGVQTAFSYPFQIPFQPDGVSPAVAVWVVDSTDAYTQLAPSQYSISGVGGDGGGIVNYPLSGSPLDANSHLIIARSTNPLQTTSVGNQGFFPQTLEQIADYITFMIQENGAEIATTIRGVIGDVLVPLPPPSQRAGKALGFDSNGQPYVINQGSVDVGTVEWANVLNPPATYAPSAHVHPVASAGNDGFMSSGDKNKLDAIIGTGGVTSVNGYTGAPVLTSADVGAVPLAQKGAALGVAPLNAGSKIDSVYLPPTHTTTVYTAASQAAMLALAGALQGDLCIRSDTSQTFVLAATPPSVLGNWVLLAIGQAVTSVNGLTGAVHAFGNSVLGLKSIKTDYGAVCDGTTDDTAAVNSAIADINSGATIALLIPGPVAVAGSLNAISVAAFKGISLIGCGYGSGFVHLSGGDVTMLSITTTKNSARSSITNLALRTKQVNLGQALYLAYTPDYNFSGEQNFVMENVMVTGWNAPQAQLDGWNRGIETYNVRSCTYNNVNAFGYVSGAAYPFNVLNSAWAWYCHSNLGTPGCWSINCRFTNCDVSWFTTAWKGRAHLEGYSWVTCCPDFVGTSWDIQLTSDQGSSAYPYFEFVNCQAEFFTNGLVIDNCSFIEVASCQFYANNVLNNTRNFIQISNSVRANVHHCLFPSSDTNGVTNGIIYTNIHEGTTNFNTLSGLAGVGIKFTGDSYQCRSTSDRMVSFFTGATIYTNDSSNANQNSRRKMQIINPASGPGTMDNEFTVGASLGNNTAAITTATSAQISCPFRVEIGDRIRVSIAAYCVINAGGTASRVTHRFREFTHRPGSANPYTVITDGGDVAQPTIGMNNWAKTSVLSGVGNEDNIRGFVEFDVVATAHDAVFNFDIFTDGTTTQTALQGNDYIRIERV